MQLADDGDVLDLLFAEFAVGAVDLGEDVARVDEQDFVVGLGLVEEPQRGRERDGVEHVRGQRQHARRSGSCSISVWRMSASEWRASEAEFAMTSAARPLVFKRGGEQVDPQVVAVGHGFLAFVGFLHFRFVARDAVGVEALVLLHAGQAHVVDVERGIGEHVIECAKTLVRVFVVGVGLLDFAAQTVDREVHLGEVDGVARFFLAADVHAAFRAFQLFAVFRDELGRLHEHAAGTAGGIEHLAAVRLDDLDHQAHHGTRREKLAAFLAFATREFGQEVFVNLAEQIAGGIRRYIGEGASAVIAAGSCRCGSMRHIRPWATRLRVLACIPR